MPYRLRILVAADDGRQAEVLRDFILDLDVESAIAVGAEEILKAAAEFQPNLVLLDVGRWTAKRTAGEVHLCDRIKALRVQGPIAVVICTQLHDIADIERAVEAGCDDFIAKPVKQKGLLARVQQLLAQGE